MSNELIKYAFVAGEISKTLFGRTDLTKYDFGVALARNWFVDYRGGLSTRPGFEFGDFIKHEDKPTKFVPFQFSPDLTNTYELLFGHHYVRFIQDNAYVLEDEVEIEAIAGDIFTIVGHDFATGDWVKIFDLPSLTFFTYSVEVLTPDTFNLVSVFDDTTLNYTEPYSGGAFVSRVYEVETPYSGDDLEGLHAYQIRDLLRLCHLDYPISNLIRQDHTDWFIEEETIGGLVGAPGGLEASASGSGSSEIVWSVTAVFEDGTESEMAPPKRLSGIVNYSVERGSVTYKWDSIPNAIYYNIYRSHISSYSGTPKMTAAAQLGYIGKSKGLSFTDANIVPDFTKSPPNRYNPFAPGRIKQVIVETPPGGGVPFSVGMYTDGDGTDFSGFTISDPDGALTSIQVLNGGKNYETPVFTFDNTAGSGFRGRAQINSKGRIAGVTVLDGGSGYIDGSTVTASSSQGSGFLGMANVTGGAVTSVTVLNQGSGYSTDRFSWLSVSFKISQSGLIGGTFLAKMTPLSGTYPSVSTIFQQRQLYAASRNDPLTFWASQPFRFSNFDYGEITLDNDYYEYEIDSASISPILHLFPSRGGLLMMSQTGIWQLVGGPSGPVTPTNALADPQTYTGVSRVPPIRVGTDLVYIEGKGYAVRLLSYNEFSRVYSGEDKSILSNHLFSFDKQISSWYFAENPLKVIWGVRTDGALVAFTVVKEQDVFAWTWGTTKGKFKTISGIEENGFDRAYVTVERIINGRTRKYFERQALRNFVNIEDSWCVDSGLKHEPPSATQPLTISPIYEENLEQYVTLTTENDYFLGKDEWWVRVADGILVIKEVLTGNEAKAFVIAPPKNFIPEDEEGRHFSVAAEEWTIGPTQKTFGGLWHLEGEEVAIQGDGSVFPPQRVVNGSVTLPNAVSKVTIGLGYEAVMQTLPPTVQDLPIEARRKRVVGVGIRLNESRGVEAGLRLDNTYPLRERTIEAYATPTLMLNGIKYQILETDWDENGQTYFVQRNPLPATILGLVPDLEVGDDTD